MDILTLVFINSFACANETAGNTQKNHVLEETTLKMMRRKRPTLLLQDT